MKKRLSTTLTWFWKYVFPSIFLIGVGSIAGKLLKSDFEYGLLMTLVWGVSFIIFYFYLMRIKNVYIDNQYLYVDDFMKTIKVPMDNIKGVSEDLFFAPRSICVEFTEKTEFGKKIKFLGYTEFFLLFKSHPSVLELQNRMKK